MPSISPSHPSPTAQARRWSGLRPPAGDVHDGHGTTGAFPNQRIAVQTRPHGQTASPYTTVATAVTTSTGPTTPTGRPGATWTSASPSSRRTRASRRPTAGFEWSTLCNGGHCSTTEADALDGGQEQGCCLRWRHRGTQPASCLSSVRLESVKRATAELGVPRLPCRCTSANCARSSATSCSSGRRPRWRSARLASRAAELLALQVRTVR